MCLAAFAWQELTTSSKTERVFHYLRGYHYAGLQEQASMSGTGRSDRGASKGAQWLRDEVPFVLRV